MPYAFTAAANPMVINEQEYGIAQSIQFTTFTSCIGVVAKIMGQDQLIGFHLVIVGTGDTRFDDTAANRIVTIANANNYDPNSPVYIIGGISNWTSDSNHVSGAYNTLIQAIKPNGAVTNFQYGDGIFGTTINQGAMELTYV